MSGLTISLITYMLTIIIALIIAVIVHFMVILLKKIPQKIEETKSLNLNDNAKIAAVLAIVKSRK